ncbi:MAG: hypothetical protein PHS90_08435 [Synergistaceae bacterium]|nr:hypothetical protein [Synergistaceae bacterium]
MNFSAEYTAPSPADVTPAQRAARDRVMLYIRGLDLPPSKGLRLAARSMEEEPSSPGEAMDALELLLDKEGLLPGLPGERGQNIPSFPPLNRSVMVAEEMDRVPWRTSFFRFLRRWRRELFGRGK